ncbi:TPA: PKHD-type hydroxylase, partial [Acinetobacter baumannii]|nr:PKHD-type hydroxylase [Acinetobacter baumannii]
ELKNRHGVQRTLTIKLTNLYHNLMRKWAEL